MGNKIPQKSVTYIIIGCAVIVTLLIVGIYPLHRALAGKDEQIAEKMLKLDEQKLLGPALQALKQKSEKKKTRLLPLPAQAPLSRDQFGRVENDLKELSVRTKMDMISYTPALGSTDDKSKTVAAEVVMWGEFASMRKFLTGLSSIPYMERIESVQISRMPDTMEMKVKFLVARN